MRSGLLISCDHYAKNSTLHIAVSFLKFSFIGLFLASLSLQWLCAGFLQLWGVGAAPLWSAWASHCCGFSLCSTGSRSAGSNSCACGLRCSVACGMFPQQGSNPCPLHQQVDAYPLHHQGSPSLEKEEKSCFLIKFAE